MTPDLAALAGFAAGTTLASFFWKRAFVRYHDRTIDMLLGNTQMLLKMMDKDGALAKGHMTLIKSDLDDDSDDRRPS